MVEYSDKDKELMLESLNIEDEGIDMKLSGEPAKMFMISLVEFFKQNGGENYITLVVEDNSGKYAITIENCNGKDTPSEKIARLEKEIENLKSM